MAIGSEPTCTVAATLFVFPSITVTLLPLLHT
jgi:hypothetical protein